MNALVLKRLMLLAAALLLAAGGAAAQSCQSARGGPCASVPLPSCPDGCAKQVPLSCHAVLRQCFTSPRLAGEPCIPGAPQQDCGFLLRCHPLYGRCVKDPPGAGDPCSDSGGCGPGLTCDTIANRCAAPSGPGRPCHPLGQPCAANLTCDDARRQCFNTPRLAGQPCAAAGDAACAPGHRCMSATTGECVRIPQSGEPCSADNPCAAPLECHPYVNKCGHVPRLAGEPCDFDRPCNASLFCEDPTMTCVPPAGAGQPCHDTRPCAAGLSCHPGIQRCYPDPRERGQPCVGPGDARAPCGDGLFCDLLTMTCERPGELGDYCWESRPCNDAYACSPATRRCHDKPRGPGDPCGGPGEPPCGNGLACHPTKRRCGRFSNAGEPCFRLTDGRELPCAAPLYCFPFTQTCQPLPATKGAPCSLAPDTRWPCRAGLACSIYNMCQSPQP